MPPEYVPDDEDYASSEDSDFAPDAVAAPVSEDSDAGSEADEPSIEKPTTKSTKRKRGAEEEAEDAGFENSGDEAIIEKGLKRQKKKGKGKRAEELEDEGGEGGLVKTRSMRAQEEIEKKPLVDTSASTIDVDALWESMISGKSTTNGSGMKPPEIVPSIEQKGTSPKLQKQSITSPVGRHGSREASTLSDGPDSMIMIKRTYNFAGKVHTEQKLVNRNSAEAKLFLASQKANESSAPIAAESESPFTKPKRPPKKAHRSRFEPVAMLETFPQRTDLHFGLRKGIDGLQIGVSNNKEAKKLTTVEKSAMDWAGFVDKEGIADELDAAGKAKGAFRGRQEFLARVEQKKEEEARRARLAGK